MWMYCQGKRNGVLCYKGRGNDKVFCWYVVKGEGVIVYIVPEWLETLASQGAGGGSACMAHIINIYSSFLNQAGATSTHSASITSRL